jgi:uncharacterized protein YecE (DUF72 family)
VDSPRQQLTEYLTSSRAYLRLHGHPNWYSSNYSTDELQKIACLAQRLGARGAERIYLFFNNDFGGYAPANALSIQKLLEIK